MITDWRGERRIGPASLGEVLAANVRLPLIITALSATASLFAVIIKATFGEHYAPQGVVDLWSLYFGAFCALSCVQILLRRAWIAAAILAVLALAAVFAAKVMALPLLTDLGLLPEVVVIVPVNP